jgi:hypothetical protein
MLPRVDAESKFALLHSRLLTRIQKAREQQKPGAK